MLSKQRCICLLPPFLPQPYASVYSLLCSKLARDSSLHSSAQRCKETMALKLMCATP
jgi:hypothetical protein